MDERLGTIETHVEYIKASVTRIESMVNTHDTRIQNLESFSNKAKGVSALVGAVAGFVSIDVLSKFFKGGQ